MRHCRFHIHYTPTYASWLNQVERWFGLITQQAIRRGSFRSVRDLTRKIDTFVTQYNLMGHNTSVASRKYVLVLQSRCVLVITQGNRLVS